MALLGGSGCVDCDHVVHGLLRECSSPDTDQLYILGIVYGGSIVSLGRISQSLWTD